jgi:hypothetical protein
MGSTTTLLLAFVFPVSAYLKLRRTPTTRRSSVKACRLQNSAPRLALVQHFLLPQARKMVGRGIVALGLLLIPACLYQAIPQAYHDLTHSS